MTGILSVAAFISNIIIMGTAPVIIGLVIREGRKEKRKQR